MTAVASPTYLGADVDGLDRLGQEFGTAAEVVKVVKAACEVIVAAASIFGPFGAAFVAYLKTTVIPWLTKIAEALTAMSKVLASHSEAQKEASSTSQPGSYTTPANLPTTSTTNYPTLPSPTPSSSAAGASTPAPATSTVTPPATIGGSTATTTGTPAVQTITALTGLVTAVDHLIHPGSSTPAVGAVDPSGAAALTSVPSITDVGAGGTPATAGTPGTVDGLTGTLTSTGSGLDVSALQPLHPGDSVGVLSVPVDVSPNGTITPLTHASTTPATVSAAPAHLAPAVSTAHLPSSTEGGGSVGSGGGFGSGGGLGGGSDAGVGAGASATPAATPHVVTAAAVHPTQQHAAAPVGVLTSEGQGADHTGLYAGIGQATGLGAGGAAVARAALHEARQRAEHALLGVGTLLPSDAAADGAVRASVLGGELA